jgi:catechol 2,3-dioxygenase-like lactoylglutathione lyase family enzyme
MPSRRIVIDHISIGVRDLERSRAFYLLALAPLGFTEQAAWQDGARDTIFGLDDADDFAISLEYPPAGASVHIAFAADSREQVNAFHAAAITAGGIDNGPPGVRTEYSPGYYGAFVLDPDGNNVEAVFHEE